MLEILGVSRNGYYSFKNRKPRNILKEQPGPMEPDGSGITYIWTYTGFVCLTSIMDLYSGKIISWVLGGTLEAEWVIDATGKAEEAQGVDKLGIMHSDRGIQYTCEAYMEATEGLERSYSKKAYPWDNACTVSFHPVKEGVAGPFPDYRLWPCIPACIRIYQHILQYCEISQLL